jgi:hypothetical protein
MYNLKKGKRYANFCFPSPPLGRTLVGCMLRDRSTRCHASVVANSAAKGV